MASALELLILSQLQGGGWSPLPLATGWTAYGSSHVGARYKLLSWNLLLVLGRVSHAAVAGTSQLATALPYAPNSIQDPIVAPLGNTAAAVQSPILELDLSGVLTFYNLPTGTTNVYVSCLYSLDA